MFVSDNIKRIILEYATNHYQVISPKLSIGTLEWFKCIMNLKREIYIRHKAFDRACRFNKFEHAKWYLETILLDKDYCDSDNNFRRVCNTLNSEFIKWFIAAFSIMGNVSLYQIEKLRKFGDLNIIKWLHSNSVTANGTGIYNFVYHNINADVVIWAISNTPVKSRKYLFGEVCESGHIDAIKILGEIGDDNYYSSGILKLCRSDQNDIQRSDADRKESRGAQAIEWCDENMFPISMEILYAGLFQIPHSIHTSTIDKLLEIFHQRYQNLYNELIKKALSAETYRNNNRVDILLRINGKFAVSDADKLSIFLGVCEFNKLKTIQKVYNEFKYTPGKIRNYRHMWYLICYNGSIKTLKWLLNISKQTLSIRDKMDIYKYVSERIQLDIRKKLVDLLKRKWNLRD